MVLDERKRLMYGKNIISAFFRKNMAIQNWTIPKLCPKRPVWAVQKGLKVNIKSYMLYLEIFITKWQEKQLKCNIDANKYLFIENERLLA